MTPTETNEVDAEILREGVRLYLSLGYYAPEKILDMLEREHGAGALMEYSVSTFDWKLNLVNIISTQLSQARRAADEEAQKEVRQERYKRQKESKAMWANLNEQRKAEAARLGLPAHTSWSEIAGINFTAAIEEIKTQAVRDFLGDLLVPQAVPGGGWKRRYDLTVGDCLAIAADYEKRAVTETGMAFAFNQLADAITEQGVTVLGEVDRSRVAATA